MKRLVAGFLAACAVLSISTAASAEDEIQLKSLDEIIDSWIDSQYQGNAEVSKIITLYNEYDETDGSVGHLITFEREGSPAGYLVLNRNDVGNPVFEFSLEGESIYDYLEDRYSDYISNAASISSAETDIDSFSMVNENILYTDFFNYSLVIDNGDEMLLFDQNQRTKELSEPIVESYALPEGYEMLPNFGGNTVYQLKLTAINKGLTAYEFGYSSSEDARLGLVSTAPTNIVKMYAENRLLDHSAPLNEFKSSEGYKEVLKIIEDGMDVKYLYNYLKFVESGLITFVNYYGSFDYKSTFYSDIEWAEYVSEIKGNRPLLVAARKNELYYLHAGIGTIEFYSGQRYLVLYSGWKPTPVYLNYDSTEFTHIDACAVSITYKHCEI